VAAVAYAMCPAAKILRSRAIVGILSVPWCILLVTGKSSPNRIEHPADERPFVVDALIHPAP
jgi:hypothetical protein